MSTPRAHLPLKTPGLFIAFVVIGCAAQVPDVPSDTERKHTSAYLCQDFDEGKYAAMSPAEFVQFARMHGPRCHPIDVRKGHCPPRIPENKPSGRDTLRDLHWTQDTCFKGLVAKGRDFSESKFGRSNLEHADLRGSVFDGAHMLAASLKHANLAGASLRSAKLQAANLQFVSLNSADLEGANLENADLRNANLRHANLINAKLSQANLEKADLSYAILRNTQIAHARFYGAKTIGTDFGNATGIEVAMGLPARITDR